MARTLWKLILALLFAVVSSTAIAVPTEAQVWSNGYSYRTTITISHTNVPNTDQTDFPVLISGTYSYLATIANGGDVTSSNGYDIIFTSDAAGSDVLPFQQESYNPSTGAIVCWVQVPTLSHTTDTNVFVFFGNASVTTDQSNKTGVWDSNYIGVWHLADNAANAVVADSTANQNTGTDQADTDTKSVNGEISGALTYNGTSDYTAVAYASDLKLGTTLSIEMWAKRNGGTGAYRGLLVRRDTSGNNEQYALYFGPSNTLEFWIYNGTWEGFAGSTDLLP